MKYSQQTHLCGACSQLHVCFCAVCNGRSTEAVNHWLISRL